MTDVRALAKEGAPIVRVQERRPGARLTPQSRIRAPLEFVRFAAEASGTKDDAACPPTSCPDFGRRPAVVGHPLASTTARTPGGVTEALPVRIPQRSRSESRQGTLGDASKWMSAKNSVAATSTGWPISWVVENKTGTLSLPPAVADYAPIPSARVRTPPHPVASTAVLASHYTIRKHGIPDEQIEKHRRWLTVQPVDRSAYGGKAETAPVVLYAEDADTFTVPRYYGLARWGMVRPENDLRTPGLPIGAHVRFEGELRPEQKRLCDAVLERFRDPLGTPGGIAKCHCGFGKTVVAVYLFCALGVRTLYTIHKEELMDNAESEIRRFVPTAKIGRIHRDRKDIDGCDFVIAMVQTVLARDYESTLFASFGVWIADEMHHMAAPCFTLVRDRIGCRYFIGLSATPRRKDNLTQLLFWSFGPIFLDLRRPMDGVGCTMVRYTGGRMIEECNRAGKPAVARMITHLSRDPKRNREIVRRLARCVLHPEPLPIRRKVIVLSDRREHLERLHDAVASYMLAVHRNRCGRLPPTDPRIGARGGRRRDVGARSAGEPGDGDARVRLAVLPPELVRIVLGHCARADPISRVVARSVCRAWRDALPRPSSGDSSSVVCRAAARGWWSVAGWACSRGCPWTHAWIDDSLPNRTRVMCVCCARGGSGAGSDVLPARPPVRPPTPDAVDALRSGIGCGGPAACEGDALVARGEGDRAAAREGGNGAGSVERPAHAIPPEGRAGRRKSRAGREAAAAGSAGPVPASRKRKARGSLGEEQQLGEDDGTKGAKAVETEAIPSDLVALTEKDIVAEGKKKKRRSSSRKKKEGGEGEKNEDEEENPRQRKTTEPKARKKRATGTAVERKSRKGAARKKSARSGGRDAATAEEGEREGDTGEDEAGWRPDAGEAFSVGYFVGGMKKEHREAGKLCDVIMATYPEADEGLNIPALDTVFFVTPRSDVEQAAGRALRVYEGKNEPLMVYFVDPFSLFERQGWKVYRYFRDEGCAVRWEEAPDASPPACTDGVGPARPAGGGPRDGDITRWLETR